MTEGRQYGKRTISFSPPDLYTGCKIEVDYDHSVYSFTPGSGWTEVSVGSGIYAYGTDTMTPIAHNETVSINGTLTVVGSDLSRDNMNVDYHGYGILSIASRDGIGDSWADYGDGGNQGLIEEIEG